MKKIFALILLLCIMQNCFLCVFATEIDEGGIHDQTGEILPDVEYIPVNPGKRDPVGTEILLVSLNAATVTDTLNTYNKQTNNYRSFNKSDLDSDSYLYFVGKMTHTDGLSVRVGVCYYNPLTGLFKKDLYCNFSSGSSQMSPYFNVSDLSSSRAYYAFVTNYSGVGAVSGWLQVYEVDPA